MRKKIIAFLFITLTITVSAQDRDVQELNKIVNPKVALLPLEFLASDKLKGRSPKRPEIHQAAQYIADHLKNNGLKQVDGVANYLQTFHLNFSTSASSGTLTIDSSRFEIRDQLLQIRGKDVSITVPIIYAGFGNNEDLNSIDVKGKIVITKSGSSDSSNFNQAYANIRNKEQLLAAKGAAALIEICWQREVPWDILLNNVNRERSFVGEEILPVFLLNAGDATYFSSLRNSPRATLSTSGNKVNTINASNVVARVQGTDSKLKDEYVVLSAHYDHLGVRSMGNTDGESDSIYNGARDNAIGVAAVMNAATYFAQHPPKRSVLFVLFTAEEMGMLGSRYFAEHPPLPFRQMVFNLNCDNGGYNDTTIATVVGLGRTSVDDEIIKACKAYNITAIPDPVPELNLFDRSDNVNFAAKGVPAPTFGMGVRSFDDEIKKYYHQPSDEVGSFNLSYALTYIRAYILAAKYISDTPFQLTWVKGDKYEPVWKKLHDRQSADDSRQ